MSDSLQFYPSGFLGSSLVELTGSLPPDIEHRTERWVGAVMRPNGMLGMKEVEDLWAAHRAGDPGVNSFEFRERILIAAKRAFGDGRFGDWLQAQYGSLFYGDYHRRWLIETAEFVMLGKPRQCTYNVWMGLLDTGRTSPCVGMVTSVALDAAAPGSKSDFLEMWVKKERGILDLLESLHVLFGLR